MTEGGVEGVLGGEAEEPDAEARSAGPVAGDGSVAAAIAVEEAEADPKARPDAAAYLQSQKLLVDLQVRHFEAERNLVHQERLLAIEAARRKRFADQLKTVVQLLVTVGAVLVAVAAIVLIRDAMVSRAVVVDPFHAPPALMQRGVSGEVVAEDVLDGLIKLQAATRSAARGLPTRGAWSSDIRIEVPETGVSIGEIDRVLRQRLGHDLHIGGDLVVAEDGGLALTVRGDGAPAQTFRGGAGDLDKLTRQAAEYVYGRSQPLQFATYLAGAGRNDEVLAFAPGAVARATDDETRARLTNIWGAAYTGLNRPAEAVARFRLAMTLKPRFWSAWSNLVGALPGAFGEEAGWREARRLLTAANEAAPGEKPELRMLANPAGQVWDLPLLLSADLEDATHNGGAGANSNIVGPQIADVHALMHDFAGAARDMAESDPADPQTSAETELLPAYAAFDAGEPALAVGPLETYWRTWLADRDLQFTATDTPCLVGLALGLTGRVADAEAVFARVGPWSRCYAYRGDVLEHAGNLPAAEQAWDAGLRVAPSSPFVYLSRGLSESRRGEIARAEADFAAAHARAPHFADPLKAWGDLLARSGRARQALAKYDEALSYAPAWPDLRRARQAVAGG